MLDNRSFMLILGVMGSPLFVFTVEYSLVTSFCLPRPRWTSPRNSNRCFTVALWRLQSVRPGLHGGLPEANLDPVRHRRYIIKIQDLLYLVYSVRAEIEGYRRLLSPYLRSRTLYATINLIDRDPPHKKDLKWNAIGFGSSTGPFR